MKMRGFVIDELEDFEEVWEEWSIAYKQRFYAGWVCGLLNMRADSMDELFEDGYIHAENYKLRGKRNGDE